ncbi:MAG: DUF1538 domain-containing protein [Gammaproteobacteria bacterium]|nr:DUF1538 domain-containing protein [Gammaproteobacteria bacterium]
MTDSLSLLLDAARDLTPIVLLILFFHLAVLRQPLRDPVRMMAGTIYVLLGMMLFLAGLELSLFGIGETMAAQLVAMEVEHYYWVYAFAATTGFATTLAEPALSVVAGKAQELSAGSLSANRLRVAVALGVGAGIALGTWRIVNGLPLWWFISGGYCLVVLQTFLAPKPIVALAYDSGGVTTSTVTVPVVAALGLELANSVPGRNALVDGFGLIAFASLFPMMTVMAYAQFGAWMQRLAGKQEQSDNPQKRNEE